MDYPEDVSMPLKNILVTGGCGFIGSNLVGHMLRRWPDVNVMNLDALTYAGNLENLAQVQDSPRYRFVRGRVEDGQCVNEALEQGEIDAVVHLAAESHVDRSIIGPGVFVTTNVMGAQVLLDAALKHGVERFLYVSTDEVYGPAPEGEVFTEDAPFCPSNPYSATKAAAELMTLAYGRTFGMPVLVSRCTNSYGPYQFPEKFIPLSIINAMEGQAIPLYGDGLQVRDWIHVEDHCRALCKILLEGVAGTAYNIAGDCAKQNRDVVDAVLAGVGADAALVRHVEDRPGHDRRYAIDPARLTRELGWRPRWNFEDGLAETIQWYADNVDWVNRVRDGSYRSYYEQWYGHRLDASTAAHEENPDE